MTYHITSEQEYPLAEFVRIMDSNHSRLQPTLGELAASLPADTTITAVCYNYPTLDLQQQPLEMSSLLLILREGGQFHANHLWLENRATQSSDRDVPTHKWNIGAVHVLRHHVLVSPDLMGFGASIDRPLCYCCGALTARNTVDAVRAAQSLLSEHYHLISSPLPVLNSGHSQGGFDALAVHRYMETEATDEEKSFFPLVHTWCADGPYMPDVLNAICCSWDKYLYGAYSVMNTISHLHYHSECFDPDVRIEDFLTEEGLALGLTELIPKRQTGNKELVKIVISALGMRTSRLLKPEAYLPEGRLYQMIMRCSEAERQTDGWMPRLPITFYHLHADECVPVELMQEVQRLWGHLPHVRFVDDLTPIEQIPNRMAHTHSGGEFHRRLLRGEL